MAHVPELQLLLLDKDSLVDLRKEFLVVFGVIDLLNPNYLTLIVHGLQLKINPDSGLLPVFAYVSGTLDDAIFVPARFSPCEKTEHQRLAFILDIDFFRSRQKPQLHIRILHDVPVILQNVQ